MREDYHIIKELLIKFEVEIDFVNKINCLYLEEKNIDLHSNLYHC